MPPGRGGKDALEGWQDGDGRVGGEDPGQRVAQYAMKTSRKNRGRGMSEDRRAAQKPHREGERTERPRSPTPKGDL